jgi:polysaccharide biosynthesis protein PelC
VHRLTLILLIALAAAGCGGPTRYVRGNVDLGAIATVAVLPFENVTNDKLSADRVHKIFLTELLNRDAFKVVEPGQVVRTLRREQFDPAALTSEDIKRLGQSLKAEALFLGSVLEYDEGRAGAGPATPRVRLAFRLVDTESGSTLWSVSRTRGGATVAARLFGVGGASASDLAQEIIRDELAALTH